MNERSLQVIVDSTFDSSKKYYKKLLVLYSEAKATEEDYNEILYELDSIRESVLAGIHLEGWCEEGILAGYEREEAL
jgi:hypothetical protein